jgi:hypothetical protein
MNATLISLVERTLFQIAYVRLRPRGVRLHMRGFFQERQSSALTGIFRPL